MIFELGSSPFEIIRVTAEYSNAVLVAVLPYISDVAQKLDLPVPHPVTAEHVIHCSVLPNRRVAAEVGIRGGWVFAFDWGYVNTVQSDHSYSVLQNPDEIPRFFGEAKMSKTEAVQLARDTLTKLSIPLESVFAEQEPQVREPWKVGSNTVPHYYVVWPDPRGGVSVHIEINGNAGRVERLSFSNRILERAPPKVNVIPQRDPRFSTLPRVNPEYARQLIPIVLRAVDDYGQKLSLCVPRPLTTNHVARFKVEDNGGWPHCELELTNDWRFVYRNSMVNGYEAPDRFFGNNQRPILIKDFVGKWNMTETQAIELVRATVAKLNYPTNFVHFEVESQIHKPFVPDIPRYQFFWYFNRNDELESTVWAEVDAGRREVKWLYYDDKHYWNRPPKIDVPILLPLSPEPDLKLAPNSRAQSPITPTNLHRPFPKAIVK